MQANLQSLSRLPLSLWIVSFCGVFIGAGVALDTAARAQASTPTVVAPRAPVVPVPASPTTTAPKVGDVSSVKRVNIPSAPGAPQGTPHVQAAGIAGPSDGGLGTQTSASAVAKAPAQRSASSRPATPAADPLILKDGPRSSNPKARPQSSESNSGGIGSTAVVVALLLALAAAGLYGRRRGVTLTPNSEQGVSVLSSLSLGPRWSVKLLQVPGRVLVVGVTEKGVNLLAEIDPLLEASPSAERWLQQRAEVDAGVRQPVRPQSLSPGPGEEKASEAFVAQLLERLAGQTPATVGSSLTRGTTGESTRLDARLQGYRQATAST